MIKKVFDIEKENNKYVLTKFGNYIISLIEDIEKNKVQSDLFVYGVLLDGNYRQIKINSSFKFKVIQYYRNIDGSIIPLSFNQYAYVENDILFCGVIPNLNYQYNLTKTIDYIYPGYGLFSFNFEFETDENVKYLILQFRKKPLKRIIKGSFFK